MDDLNAAPSSTEPAATSETLAPSDNALGEEAGAAASGESNAAAPDAGAAADLSAPSGFVGTAASTPSEAAADAEGPASEEGDASAAAGLDQGGMASAPPASTGPTSSLNDASSLAELATSLPHRVAQHLESIFQIVSEHARQLANPAKVAGAELAIEIDDLLHKLSNGIAVSDGRIVAKLAALRSRL